jgi:hypothetical protein
MVNRLSACRRSAAERHQRWRHLEIQVLAIIPMTTIRSMPCCFQLLVEIGIGEAALRAMLLNDDVAGLHLDIVVERAAPAILRKGLALARRDQAARRTKVGATRQRWPCRAQIRSSALAA